jgi:uncharacterized repeat protein (TIGR01451 family)
MRIPTTLSTFPARRWWALPLGMAALVALFGVFHFGKAFAAAQPAALLRSPAVSDSVTNPAELSIADALAQAQGSDLTINTYLASGAVSPGYELTYDLTFANGGPDPAEDVIITATLPLSTTYLTYSGAYSPTVSGRQLIWSIGALPAHSSNNLNYTIYLDEATPVDSVLTNTVQIATTTTDPDLTNNSATLTNTVTSSTPDLSLSTNWAGAVARDSEITYYLYYQNNSYGQLALATVISNTLPEGVTFRRARWLPQYDESRAVALTPTIDGNTLHFALGVIPGIYQGAYYGWLEVVAYVAADVPADTTLTNRATILTASNDPNLTNNTTERSGVVVEPTRDLHLGQSYSGGTLLPGDTVTFYLSYVNYGNAHLPDTVITDTLPAGLTFVSASDEYPFTVTDNTIVWQIGAVAGYGAPGYAGNFSLTAQVAAETPPGTILRNRIVGAIRRVFQK